MDDDTTTRDDQYLTDVLSYSVDRLSKVRFLFLSFFFSVRFYFFFVIVYIVLFPFPFLQSISTFKAVLEM
jgi:hypothetical protein